jgi:hypothetical protein
MSAASAAAVDCPHNTKYAIVHMRTTCCRKITALWEDKERTRRGKVKVGGRKKVWKKRKQEQIEKERWKKNEKKERYRVGGRQHERKEK